MSAHRQGDRSQEVSALPAGTKRREEEAMTPAEISCVVGIDVAKQTHVVCALEAPGGALRHKPSQIEATQEGYALLLSWLASWHAGGRQRS
jgi:hypothetical protein